MDVFEPFTTPELYEVEIIHPLGLTVTVRSLPSVKGSEYRGFLRTGWTVKSTLDVRDSGEVWARIVESEDAPETEGYYFALVYPNLVGKLKVFGEWDLITDTPPEQLGEFPRYSVVEDWKSPFRGYKVRSTAKPGTPAIQPTSSTENNWPQTDFARFPLKWQNFAKDLLCMQRYSKVFAKLTKEQKNYINSKFKDMYAGNKAFTNTHGIETNSPRIESLVCMGNDVYEIARTTATAGKYRGKVMIMLYSFDMNDEPPVVTLETLRDPRVQYAKVVYQPKEGALQGYLGNFPHLEGLPVPFPFLTSGRHWIPLQELEGE